MAITRSQMARQLFSLGGVIYVNDDNLRSLGLGILGAPLTDLDLACSSRNIRNR